MSRVAFKLTGFTGGFAAWNKVVSKQVQFIDLQRAIITVGSHPHVLQPPFGIARVYKNVALSAMARCVLDFTSPSLTTTALFKSLVPSEKGSFSYWFGMAFLAIAAERYMNIPWLVHVDPLVLAQIVTLAPNASTRGDLVGFDTVNGNWDAFEAKGRSQRISAAVLNSAKHQAMQIHTVYNAIPATWCASGVSLGRTPVSVTITDPKKHGVAASTSGWPPDSFFSFYYGTLNEYLADMKAQVATRFGMKFRMAPVVDATGSPNGYSIGVPEAVFSDPRMAPKFMPTDKIVAQAIRAGVSLGRNGVVVEKG